MLREVLIALGAISSAVAVLYLEFGRTDPCMGMTELAAQYAVPLSEAELQATATANDSLEAAIQRKRLETQKMREAMPDRVTQRYTAVTRRCARSFR